MSLTKVSLVSTAAMSVSLSVAFADGNTSNMLQNGERNAASVSQNRGDNNTAGSADVSGGAVGQSILQAGNDNDLDVRQTGDNNNIAGAGLNGLPRIFRQTGNFNAYDLLQSGNNNQQNVLRRVMGPNSSIVDTNNATVRQRSDNNIIGKITQRYTGAGSSGDANELRLVQRDLDGNEVDTTSQSGDTNAMNSRQTGGNKLTTLADQDGSANDMRVVLSGNNNGRFQTLVTLTVGSALDDGDDNLSATLQEGRGNMITGDSSQVVVTQFTSTNAAQFAQAGSFNNTGISQ